jgi:hypothetical protein
VTKLYFHIFFIIPLRDRFSTLSLRQVAGGSLGYFPPRSLDKTFSIVATNISQETKNHH